MDYSLGYNKRCGGEGEVAVRKDQRYILQRERGDEVQIDSTLKDPRWSHRFFIVRQDLPRINAQLRDSGARNQALHQMGLARCGIYPIRTQVR